MSALLIPAGGWTPKFVADEMSRAEGEMRSIASLVRMDCQRLREYVELRDAAKRTASQAPAVTPRPRTAATAAMEFAALANHHCDYEIDRLTRKAAALREAGGPTAEQIAEDDWRRAESDRRLNRLVALSEEHQRLGQSGERLIQGSLFDEAAA